MAICPFANRRLIDPAYLSGGRIAVYSRTNLHVQAGLGSLYGFFNAPRRASSHFWTAKSGLIEQYVDTARMAEADLDGNDATISIETEGGTGPNADTEQWTPAQLDALIRLCQWIADTHGIRKIQAASSKADASSLGQSWHRLGIDGNFPALPDIRAGRLQRGGGMKYSTARGKVCPGGGKIQQIPTIVAAIRGGTPPPQQDEEDDVSTYYEATSSSGAIIAGWTFEQGPDGILRALQAGESAAHRQVHPQAWEKRAKWTGRDIENLAAAVGLWEYTGTSATGPLGLTGRLLGRNAPTDVDNGKGDINGRGYPPVDPR